MVKDSISLAMGKSFRDNGCKEKETGWESYQKDLIILKEDGLTINLFQIND